MTNHELQTLLALDRSTLPEDGRPEFNRLIFSRSPYLLQHSRNPVDWREWGPAAQKEAQERNLRYLSPSAMPPATGAMSWPMNPLRMTRWPISLTMPLCRSRWIGRSGPIWMKFCMAACQSLTNSGGWPLNCFLKPDGTPFYALTYRPKSLSAACPVSGTAGEHCQGLATQTGSG